MTVSELSPTLDEFVVEQVKLIAVLAAAFGLCMLLCPVGTNKLELAHILLWLPFTPYLLYCCYRATFELSGSLEDRWFGSSPASIRFMNLYVAAQVLGSAVELVSPGPVLKKVPMILHHVTSVFCFGYGVTSGRMSFWANFAGICETSTLFLNVVLLSKIKGGGVSAWLEKNLGGLPLMANSFLLWLSFLLCRIVLFPCWLWWFVSEASVVQEQFPAKFAEISTFEYYGYAVTVFFIWSLSAMWFNRIHAGFVKVAKGMLKQKE